MSDLASLLKALQQQSSAPSTAAPKLDFSYAPKISGPGAPAPNVMPISPPGTEMGPGTATSAAPGSPGKGGASGGSMGSQIGNAVAPNTMKSMAGKGGAG